MRDGEVEYEAVHRTAGGEHRLERLQGPDGDQYGQDQERRPCLEDFPKAVGRSHGGALLAETTDAGAHHGGRDSADDVLAGGAFWLPDFQEQGQGNQTGQGRGDVRQFRADEVRGEVLGHSEAQAGYQRGRPGLFDAAQAVHHEHQPERHEQRQQRQLAAGHGADLERVDTGHLPGNDDRNAQGAEGHWRGVGDQAQAGGVQRVEAQAHQQRGSDCHRCAKACRTFQEGTEAEADQQHLQALVVGDRQHRAADHFELAALDREFVQEHRGNDDPGNRPEAVEEAITRSGECHVDRHLEGEDRHQDRQCEGDAAGHVAFEAEHGEGEEEEDDGNDRRQCGQAKTTKRTIDLLPGLHMGWPLIVVGQALALDNW
ncbi:hypothetical protein D3C75_629260 [compost metagenome]